MFHLLEAIDDFYIWFSNFSVYAVPCDVFTLTMLILIILWLKSEI